MKLAAISAALLLLATYPVSASGPGYGEWKPCPEVFMSLIKTLQDVITGMENDKAKHEMYMCGKELAPCEFVIIRNFQTLNLTSEAPASRRCEKDNDDCFKQKIPLQVTKYCISCRFQNELTALVSLLQFFGVEFCNLICGSGPAKDSVPCKAALLAQKTGDGIKKGLGAITTGLSKLGKKRDVSFNKREADCKADDYNFWIDICGDLSILNLTCTHDWSVDKTTIDTCEFTQKSLIGVQVKIGGKISLLGQLGNLLTDKIQLLSRLLGVILQAILKPVVSKCIKDNEMLASNANLMTCGD